MHSFYKQTLKILYLTINEKYTVYIDIIPLIKALLILNKILFNDKV